MKSNSRKKDGACVKCGTCNTVCPVYQATGNEIHTPRGKQHLRAKVEKGEVSAHYADIFSQCLLCGACKEVCPRGLDTPALVVAVRSELPKLSGLSFIKYLSRKALVHPTLLTGLAKVGAAASSLLGKRLPQESGMRLRLQGLAQQGLKPPATGYIDRRKKEIAQKNRTQEKLPAQAISFFTGCLANHLQPQIAESTQFLLEKTTGSQADVPDTQTCCGMAAMAAGKVDEARELAQKNIRAFEANELPILTSCSSCYYQLKSYAELFADDPEWRKRAEDFAGRLQEFSTFFLERLSAAIAVLQTSGTGGSKVLYHDPCHLRFKLHITKEPRQLIRLLPDVELQELPDGPQCCGHGGLFQVAHPDLARQVLGNLRNDFSSLAVDTVLTACSGCLLQWQQSMASDNKGGKAEHLAVFIARLLQ